MSIAIERVLLTPDDLLTMPEAVGFELVNGELRDRHMSALSSWVGGRLFSRLSHHVETHQLGWVFPADNGFRCFPDSPKTVRRPDVSFVRLDRLAADKIGDGWLRLVPDLVVEVVSPYDQAYDVEQKLEEYFQVGVPLFWLVMPPTRSIRINRGDGSTATLREGDELSGEDIIPGFSCRVADLFLPAALMPREVLPA